MRPRAHSLALAIRDYLCTKTLPTQVNNSAPFYDSRSELSLELILMVSIDIMTNKLNMQSRAGSNAPALSRLPRILQEQTV